MVNPASATPVDAYGGWVSDDRVVEGEKVLFSGTFHNYLGITTYLFFMNITFVEKLGVGATREPNRPNITKEYESTRRPVIANSSITDTVSSEIDFEPGAYNVTIFFQYSNATAITAATTVGTVYALINASFVVEGLTQTLQIFRTIGVIIGIAAIGVIVLLVYNSRFKR